MAIAMIADATELILCKNTQDLKKNQVFSASYVIHQPFFLNFLINPGNFQ